MSDEPDHRYVVLSEGAEHLVCVRRVSEPSWLQIIATFADKGRADQYADVENMFAEDRMVDGDGLGEEEDVQGVTVPTTPLPRDGLLRITARETRETRHTVSREITAEEVEHPAPLAIEAEPDDPPETLEILEDEPIETDEDSGEDDETAAGRIPEFILRLLPVWMDKYPIGPTIKQVAAETKLPEEGIRAAFNLLKLGGAVVYQGREDRALHVLPPGSAIPEQPELSINQEAVLGYLEELPPAADGAVTPPSWDHISDTAKIPKGSIGSVLNDLERKGKIEVVAQKHESGSTMQKSRYRVVNRQILRQAIAREGGPKDVSHLVFDDPQPGRVKQESQ